MTTLRQKVINSVLWNTAESVTKRGIGFVVTLLLARFLSPDDFGLIALLSIFIAIASSIMESGFRQALIRKTDASDTDFSTVFYTNLLLALVSYALLFASAPLISNFYNEPRLTSLVRYVGIVIIINAFSVVQYAILSRAIDFKSQMFATFPATFLSGCIAVVMAYLGCGVWALVAQMLFAALFTTLFLWHRGHWRPSWAFSKESLREMFDFGSKLFASGLIDLAFKNVYVAVIAKLFAANYTGYYFFAQRFQELVVGQLTGAIGNVTYPVFSTMQDNDARMLSAYRKVIQLTTYIVFPAMTLLSVLAEPVLCAIVGSKWLPAAPYLQLLCVVGMLYPLHSINLNILKVKGRSDLFLRLELLKKVLVVLALVCSIPFGIRGIIIGQIVLSVVAYIPNSYYAVQLIGYGPMQQVKDFGPNLFLAIGAGVITHLMAVQLPWSGPFPLIVAGSAGIGGYIGFAHMVKLSSQLLLVSIAKGKF